MIYDLEQFLERKSLSFGTQQKYFGAGYGKKKLYMGHQILNLEQFNGEKSLLMKQKTNMYIFAEAI